jgi:hypothetical protein
MMTACGKKIINRGGRGKEDKPQSSPKRVRVRGGRKLRISAFSAPSGVKNFLLKE